MKWIDQCSSGWIQDGDYFEFHLTKGIPGKCAGDDKPLKRVFRFKERQEVRSDYLLPGKYIWSADIQTISDQKVHAESFTLFQIHDHRRGGRPPHSIQVRRGRIYCINEKESPNNDEIYVSKYNGKHTVEAKIEINKKNIIVDYIIDKKEIGRIIGKQSSDTLFVKFGAYRWNAVCDVKQIYRNLKFERIDVS